MIDVRRVTVLREVARLGSFNQAAAALMLTPSAVSQQISALERELGGTAVVQRSTRGVTLTAAGRVLVDAGDAIAAELSQAEREIARLGTPAGLTVATFTSGGQRLLPPALTRFAEERPGVELTVLENDPPDALPLVRSGAADLALVYHFDDLPPVRPGDRSGMTWTPLLDDPMWIVLPEGHRLAGRESVTVAELAGERWVHGCLEIVDMLDHYAALAGFEIRTACRGTDYVFAQSLVRAGVGISMIPQVALTAAPGGLAMVPLAPPCPCRYIGIVTPQRRRPNPLADALVHALRETVAALPAPHFTAARVPAST
ncbi:LysR family transcriptional regulator [Paractinoplanes brasiliensis]|uniref:DNA-binding transcriptional LysR family regulator n=1 Tax=Paractinoplanes brasiliensis TaxID=52695 RepID=A0A4R6K0E6_9ACTN|nr:LysR family transcriptional regulator [Actinoplanes brasiliensis]TDO42634.1 DNA-binding transcriptional LysR family regulator [Actinoplanes brasiliensis]GID31262.1 LysR family transcriptional regulator [Actinoplanes brasiliensis]